MTRKTLKEGDFVRLDAEHRKLRIDEMARWEGTVEGFVSFPWKILGITVESRQWVRVNWGRHHQNGYSFNWLERPEDLTIV